MFHTVLRFHLFRLGISYGTDELTESTVSLAFPGVWQCVNGRVGAVLICETGRAGHSVCLLEKSSKER